MHAIEKRHGLSVHQFHANAPGHTHEVVEHAPFDPRGVFHADGDTGEQAFKNAWRREVVGGANLVQANAHRAARLGAVHHVAADQPLGERENVLAYPCRWQIGQHLLVFRQLVKTRTGLGTVHQRCVGVHHALGVAGGARGEKECGDVVALALVHLVVEEGRMCGVVCLSHFNQRVE